MRLLDKGHYEFALDERVGDFAKKPDAHLTTKALLSSGQESSSIVVDQKAPQALAPSRKVCANYAVALS
jgi:hypothetical protein